MGVDVFVAMSRFRVRAGQEEMTNDAFRSRPHRVDAHPGFIRMEVLAPQDHSNEYWLLTFWEDRESFEQWHRHHLNESHAFMPRGLKVERDSRVLRYFDLVTE